MRHRALHAVTLAALGTLAVIAACGRDLEGLTGGDDPLDAASDGGPASSESGTLDGSSDATIEPSDAEVDAPADAGTDACAACVGVGASCNAGFCTILCTGNACTNKAVCGPGLDCTMSCATTSACSNVSCAPGARSCKFDCTTGTPACSNITCNAPSCLVTCTNAGRCDGNVALGGGDAGLLCSGNQSCDSVDSVSCSAGKCYLDCTGSCPATKACDGGICTGAW